MTSARNTSRPPGWLSYWLPALAVVLTVASTRPAQAAQVFAPICDLSGASAIADLPATVGDYGEINALPCSTRLAFDFEQAPADPDNPAPIVIEGVRTVWFQNQALPPLRRGGSPVILDLPDDSTPGRQLYCDIEHPPR